MKPYLLIFLFLVVCSCSKSDDGPKFSLPLTTQTGENTFGCYIDGKLLIPRDGEGSFNSPDYGLIFWGSYNDTYNDFDVHDFASEKTASINLHIIGLDSLREREYIVNKSNCYDGIDSFETNNIYCRIWDSEDKIYKQYCSFENSGIINITRYDMENYIISGTFSGKAIWNEGKSDTIEITNGRFDLKLDHLPTNFP